MKTLRKKLDTRLGEYQHYKRQVTEEKRSLAEVRQRIADTEQAQRIIQAVAESVQREAHRQIAAVVTRCLSAVFGEDAYEFAINFRQSRGKTEAEIVFLRNGKELDPLSSSGGGAVDVASFALRLACLSLSIPRKRRFLLLDEPLKHLSPDRVPAARKLLEMLASELSVQILLTTHSPGLRAGKLVELT